MTQSLEFLVFREKKVYSHSSNFGFKMVLTWVMVILKHVWLCTFIHISRGADWISRGTSELPGKGPVTAACCYKEAMWAVLGYTHRHTNTHTCISHIHTLRMSHSLHRHMQTCHTQTRYTCTRMSHIHIMSWKYTWTHTYSQHMSTSILIRTLSPPFWAACTQWNALKLQMTEAQLLMNVSRSP